LAGPIDQAWEKWEPWHPAEAAGVLADVRAPWYVAAGWAIDLFLGGHHREHEDLEIAVPSDRFAEVAAALGDYELYVPGRIGDRYVAWAIADEPERLEMHDQTLVREPATDRWRLDVFREPSDGDAWICKRDATIRMPYAELIERTSGGIPYARPEIVLLFKATRSNPDEAIERDEADFAAVLEVLEPRRRRVLAQLLAHIAPRHPWLGRLA
jgi:hypothetical protein